MIKINTHDHLTNVVLNAVEHFYSEWSQDVELDDYWVKRLDDEVYLIHLYKEDGCTFPYINVRGKTYSL